MKTTHSCLLFTLAVTVLFSFSAFATILHVPQQYSTIQAAIDAAQDGDTVLVEPGTYYEHLEILTKGLTLSSNFLFTGDESYIGNTIIDANGLNNPAIKIINSGRKTSLYGITLQNGISSIGGGVHSQGSNLIDHCVIRNNVSESSGGGIYYYGNDGSDLVVTNCIIENNTSHGVEGGGGIYINDGSTNYVSIKNNIIRNNIVNVDYHGNDYGVEAYGGGITDRSITTSLILWNNIICNNQVIVTTDYDSIPVGAIARGGGIYCRFNCPLNAYNCLIYGNSCYAMALDATETAEGGGIYTSSCNLINSTVTGNMVSVESGPAGEYGGIRAGSPSGYNNIIYNNIPSNGTTGFSNSYYNDPLFISGPEGDYYLSQLESGQLQQSPCVNTGLAAGFIVGTTRTDGFPDDNLTDIGFHYPSPSIGLNLTVFLEGPYNGTSMNQTLAANDLLPLNQPFNLPPWNYYGTESLTEVPSNVVDWVLVELWRTSFENKSNPNSIIGRQAAFLTQTGKITGLSGNINEPIEFRNVTLTDSIFVVIRHRNHLSIMSAEPISGSYGGVFEFNFSLSSGQVYGGAQGSKQLSGSVWGLVGGDGNADGAVNNQDKINIWQVQAPGSGYRAGDFNLDGQVNNLDKIMYWSPNVGRSSQVPALPNQPPSIPFNPVPADESGDQPLNLSLTWSCNDYENDPLTFDVYFGTTNPPPLISTAQVSNTYNPPPLSPSIQYYWKIVAHDNEFSVNGPVWSFISAALPCPGVPSVTYLGQEYQTVLIGTQCWIKENLNAGNMIPSSSSQTNNSIFEKYCYGNDTSLCTTYGGLYQWDEMMQYTNQQGVQGICPSGWHIPTNFEFNELATYLGGVNTAGGKMKESGVYHWNTQSAGANNISGFTGLPAGLYSSNNFIFLGTELCLWTSTEINSNEVNYLILSDGSDNCWFGPGEKAGKALSVRCLYDQLYTELPGVETYPVSDITNISATGGGNVISEGASIVTARGVCWSTNQNPTLANSYTIDGSGPGEYVSQLTGLAVGTTYYVRAYATNSFGTKFGDQVTFSTYISSCPGISEVSYQGKTYNTILIGSQCWFSDNLDVGVKIQTWPSNNGIIEKWCYGNSDNNCAIYGALYHWDEMMQYTTQSGAQGICPTDWHIPTDTEWITLSSYLGGSTVAGGEMKETGIVHWQTPNTGATNSSGFTALPGGYKSSGQSANLTATGQYWSSKNLGSNAVSYKMSYLTTILYSENQQHSNGYSVRCIYNSLFTSLPTVQTMAVTNVTNNSASGGGNVTSEGSSPVTSRGICWSTNSNPTLSDSYTINGSGLGEFTSLLTNLNPGSQYYVKAYATNSFGTAYGNQINFITGVGACPGLETVNYSGQLYNTIWIGTQCWFKENLNIGSMIPTSSNQANNQVIEKYCYGNNANNCSIYGGLYQWNEAMQYSAAPASQGICPDGWHIPTDPEWTVLSTYLGGVQIAGGKMTETGTTHWHTPNTGATNSSGFTGLPGGYRLSDNGSSTELTLKGYFWSSTEYSSTHTRIRYLDYYNAFLEYDVSTSKTQGHSVRCVRDIFPTVQTSVVSDISFNLATCGGTVVSEGASDVTARGVCWSTSPNPTLSDFFTIDGSGLGHFTSLLTGLNQTTTYYVRAYATNNIGTVYGNQGSFTTLVAPPCMGQSSLNYGGQLYNLIEIGTQCWMRENLNIGTQVNGTTAMSNNSVMEKYCYQDIATNCNVYGGLYQWNEAMQYNTIPGSQGICPAGWHIPTDEQWTTITAYLEGSSIAGGALKEAGTTHWLPPNTGATNSSQFTALPAGYRDMNTGSFGNLGTHNRIWSSTEGNPGYALKRTMNNTEASIYSDSGNKNYGFTVRCVKD